MLILLISDLNFFSNVIFYKISIIRVILLLVIFSMNIGCTVEIIISGYLQYRFRDIKGKTIS